jgi:peptide/nickel transport system permease protein
MTARRPALPLPQVVRDVLAQRSGRIGVAIVCLHLAVAMAAPMIAPQDPTYQDASAMLQSPSLAHWFGTDRLGRDVLSRTLLGGREAMLIATAATIIAMAWGSAVGILVALIGGRIDAIVMRFIDAMMSIPWILLVMLFFGMVPNG